MDQKNKTHLNVVHKKPTLNIKTHQVKKWRKIYHYNSNQKKAGISILIIDRANFRVKKVIGNKEKHYIMIKGSILQGDITILNVYAHNKNVYVGQNLIEQQREIDKSTVIVGEFNTLYQKWSDLAGRKLIRT